MCTSFYFPDSGLYLLDGFDFYFDLYLNGVTLKTSNIHSVYKKKISICLNRGREKSVGNDDVSIVCARKYEMVRMT